jgi:choline transporter-like protein 2/4/5
VQDRGCTDILCCFVFLAFLVGMVATSFYGFLYGDPKLLLTAWDGLGRGCGYNASVADYPYLYFPTIDLESA